MDKNRKAALSTILIAGFAALFSACANPSIAAARKLIAAGQFAQARATLAEARNTQNLTPAEQREAADGICLSEYRLGPPSYPLGAVRADCAAATQISGSASGPTLAAVDAQLRDERSREVERALRAGHLETARAAALQYTSYPG